uniref:LAGLIDADG endonuclease n=1 Tax=Botryotinia fuckeliana (strain B05.10) TaxID=332648 RepID=R9U4N5_BOTFB|nr:LAGLIDADG endonuclease [Botrytis cinerea B05.10]
MFVKEQRVDGSWFIGSCPVNLRYTLRGFERISWAGIPSNQILSKRLYSTTNNSKNLLQPKLSTIDKGSFSLNPWFVTGFIDGDGSFAVSIAKKKSGIGWKIQPILTIGLDQKDLDLLVQIKDFFKVGKIYTSKRGIIYYTVGSTKDLIKYILPHFDKYPLATAKLKDYLVFKKIILLMEKGEHNYLPGLLKIFSLRAILNKGLPGIIKTEFPYIIPTILPEFKVSSDFNPHWLSGFIAAEGSFFISLYSNEKRKAGYAVSLVFSLSQHVKDIELLERLAKYLKCGRISEASNRETAEWIVSRSDDINLKLIPFLTNYTLSGVKLLDFERFKKASILIENKMHLTPEGVTLVKAIKDAMYNR